MASLSNAKVLGGIGSILIFIPFISLIGYILLIVAVKDISDVLQDRSIFNNIVIAAASGIVGAFAGGLLIVYAIVGAQYSLGLAGRFDVVAGLLVAWVFLVVSAVFLRRAYDTVGEKLQVGTFNTAATIYLIGAGLTIVAVGLLLLFVAEIVQAIAYFSIPDQPPGTVPGAFDSATLGPQVPAPASIGEARFCKSCGTKLSPTATFCYRCGAKQ
jgi:uncharacterized membrane protein